jgi:hypothetical protein
MPNLAYFGAFEEGVLKKGKKTDQILPSIPETFAIHEGEFVDDDVSNQVRASFYKRGDDLKILHRTVKPMTDGKLVMDVNIENEGTDVGTEDH